MSVSGENGKVFDNWTKARADERWRARPVDGRIKPLVIVLNRAGFAATLSSCEGHFWRSLYSVFVMFTAPLRVAAAISERVTRLHLSGALHHFWAVSGHFDGDNRLAFKLHIPGLERLGAGLSDQIEAWWLMAAGRSRIDADVRRLASELSSLPEHIRQPAEDGDGDKNAEDPIIAPPPRITPEGIGITTAGTACGVTGYGLGADTAFDQGSHLTDFMGSNGDKPILPLGGPKQKEEAGALTGAGNEGAGWCDSETLLESTDSLRM